MIRGILFDKDGTLFDFNLSWGVWARNFIDDFTADPAKRAALAEAFLLDYETRRFLPTSPIIAGTSKEMFSAVQSVFPDIPAAEIADAVRNSTRAAQLVPVCDLQEYCASLKAKGFLLGIATNDDETGARRQLERENAAQYFDFFAGYDSGYGPKPEPGMCKGFLTAMKLKPEEAIMVGDSPFDLMAGRGAQMRTIGVLTGAAGEAELKDADAILPDITSLPEWLELQK